MAPSLKLKEIADRINAHLKRMEQDPALNTLGYDGKPEYQGAKCEAGDSKVGIVYKSYMLFPHVLTKAQATKYLAWLDAGNNTSHFEAPFMFKA